MVQIERSFDSLPSWFLRTHHGKYSVNRNTPTGFAAVALSIMSICRPGDEILISDGVYRPTQKLTDDLLKEFKVKSVWYNPNSFEDFRNKITIFI